jgi:hypothetical protein
MVWYVGVATSARLNPTSVLCSMIWYVGVATSACRFSYSPEFLSWALQPPGYRSNWHVGVRVKGSGKLVAFISGIPSTLLVSLDGLVAFASLETRVMMMLVSASVQQDTQQCGVGSG